MTKMSKLKELIQQYCPDGVVYRNVSDVAEVSIGEFVHKNKQHPDGKYPVYNGGTGNTGYYDDYNRTANKIIISARGANAGFVNRVFTNYWSGNSCYTVDITDKNFDWNFVFYWLKSNELSLLGEQQKGGIPAVSKKQVERFRIPVPPLPVQREIVRILDKFTELTEALIAELTMELTARKKQYEFYRDKLLTFGDVQGGATGDVVWRTLGGICKKVVSGGTPQAGNPEYYGGTIPWLRTQEVGWKDITDTAVKITEAGLNASSAKWIPENCVIVAMYGATAAKVAINKVPLTTNQACCNLEIDEKQALYRYVFHWLCKEYFSLKALGQGSQSNINAQTIKQYKIPVPSLEVQAKIVNVLDNFDAI